ncbi:MAG: DNA repair protein RecO [Bacillus sp. (in: Bacteria)]|nr:DNA repair protein RecO [Bacillus sp. (in: firmicutes)]
MKEYLVDAIVLKSVRAREADRIITLYTRQSGKKKVIAYGAEKPASRKRGAVQPFSCSRLLLRRGRDLDTVVQGEILEYFTGLRQSLKGLAAANYLAELVDAFTPDEDPNPAIFDLLLETFRVMESGDRATAAWAFQIKLVSLLGYRPGLDACVICESPVPGKKICFLPEQGGIVCSGCRPEAGQGLEISRGTLESIKTLMRWDTRRLHQIKIDPSSGREIKKAIGHFIEYHLEKEIKSGRFMDLVDHR